MGTVTVSVQRRRSNSFSLDLGCRVAIAIAESHLGSRQRRHLLPHSNLVHQRSRQL